MYANKPPEDDHYLAKDLPSFDLLFSLTYPSLKILELDWIRFSGAEFCHYLQRRPSVKENAVMLFHLVDGRQKTVFDTIRTHHSVDDLELHDMFLLTNKRSTALCVSTHRDDVGYKEYQPELHKFVQGVRDGPEALSEVWRGVS